MPSCLIYFQGAFIFILLNSVTGEMCNIQDVSLAAANVLNVTLEMIESGVKDSEKVNNTCEVWVSWEEDCDVDWTRSVFIKPSQAYGNMVSVYYWFEEKREREQLFVCSKEISQVEPTFNHDAKIWKRMLPTAGGFPVLLEDIKFVSNYWESYYSFYKDQNIHPSPHWAFAYQDNKTFSIQAIFQPNPSNKTIKIYDNNNKLVKSTFTSSNSASIEFKIQNNYQKRILSYSLEISNTQHSNRIEIFFREAFMNKDKEIRKVEIDKGGIAVLKCRLFSSFPLVDSSWNVMYDGAPDSIIHNDKFVKSIHGDLVVYGVTEEDTNTYFCESNQFDLEIPHSYYQLSVIPTTFRTDNYLEAVLTKNENSEGINDYEKEEKEFGMFGKSCWLECLWEGRPFPSLTWKKTVETSPNKFFYEDLHNKEYIIDEIIHNKKYIFSNKNMTLEIKDCSFSDEGSYLCAAVSKVGEKQKMMELIVHEKAHFKDRMISQNASEGNEVVFECSHKGVPKANTLWYFAGKSLNSDKKNSRHFFNFTIENGSRKKKDKNKETNNIEWISRLVLKNVKVIKSTVVECQIHNNISFERQQAFLTVYKRTRIDLNFMPTRKIDNFTSVDKFNLLVQTDELTNLRLNWTSNDIPLTFHPQDVLKNKIRPFQKGFADLNDQSSLMVATNKKCYFFYSINTQNQFNVNCTNLTSSFTIHSFASNEISNHSINFQVDPIYIYNLPKISASTIYFSELLSKWWIILTVLLFSLVTLVILGIFIRKTIRKNKTFSKTSLEVHEAVQNKTFFKSMRGNSDLNNHAKHLSKQLLSSIKTLQIPRHNIELIESIGNGHFGRVYLAKLKRGNQDEKVAVKTMKYRAEESDMVELFLKEAVTMKHFQHQHVLGIKGISFEADSTPMVVLPYMEHGDLKNYILQPTLDITIMTLLRMGLQVAEGMDYLAVNNFVHRDLAARNCMIDDTGVVKIADFGMSRQLLASDYYRVDHDKDPVPIRWMAPECLEANIFTTKSDVWAYGVLLWELLTRGAVPYPEAENWEVVNIIQKGKLLEQPPYCPDDVYNLMLACWKEDSHNRPNFSSIVNTISSVLTIKPSPHKFNSSFTHSIDPDFRQNSNHCSIHYPPQYHLSHSLKQPPLHYPQFAPSHSSHHTLPRLQQNQHFHTQKKKRNNSHNVNSNKHIHNDKKRHQSSCVYDCMLCQENQGGGDRMNKVDSRLKVGENLRGFVDVSDEESSEVFVTGLEKGAMMNNRMYSNVY